MGLGVNPEERSGSTLWFLLGRNLGSGWGRLSGSTSVFHSSDCTRGQSGEESWSWLLRPFPARLRLLYPRLPRPCSQARGLWRWLLYIRQQFLWITGKGRCWQMLYPLLWSAGVLCFSVVFCCSFSYNEDKWKWYQKKICLYLLLVRN